NFEEIILQDAFEHPTTADDLFEVVLTANLFFEIQLLFLELVLQRLDLVIGKRVFDGDGNLVRHLFEQLAVFTRECVRTSAFYRQHTKHTVSKNKWGGAACRHAMNYGVVIDQRSLAG